MDKERLLRIINEHGILPDNKFGQNFLCDDDLCSMIAEEATAGMEGPVLEIGPGIGAVTEYLLRLNKEVTAIEIDKRLASYLKAAPELKGLDLIVNDYLKLKATDYNASSFLGAVSNIPYYVTTPIMIKMITELKSCKSIVLMVEKAALERILAHKNSKQYGPLAILLSLFGNVDILTNVGPDSFYPAPHTVSSVIKITAYDDRKVLTPAFASFLEACFSQRRKKLSNSLKSYQTSNSLPPVEAILSELNISSDVRAEDLDAEIFEEIYLRWGA